MKNQPRASSLAREGFELWQAGRPEDAVSHYAQALELSDPGHYALADYHGEFAAVLDALGRHEDAQEQLELAARVQQSLDGDEGSLAVSMARYFLADHLLRHGKPVQALEVVAASLPIAAQSEWLLRAVEAQALHATSRPEEASNSAVRALRLAPSEAKRMELHNRFASLDLLGASDA